MSQPKQPNPGVDPFDDEEILARTLWGEARGEDRLGREMIASVIMNRVRADLGNDGKPDWWGEGIIDVCLAPWQFSCWLPGDPNRAKLLAVDITDPIFAECFHIACAAIDGDLKDTTCGATHYLNETLVMKTTGRLPAWADPARITASHGRHVFYKLA